MVPQTANKPLIQKKKTPVPSIPDEQYQTVHSRQETDQAVLYLNTH